ncbi:unnamed protein product [Adineta ricciae]|uniref:mRNA capping enzyme adenylation domain-containing protein n=1 Tax=Adineta ricciae TaxID=249248 RepID=A0A815C0G6_ADIRI|nr:unnamed protein product [Adineta ricciae]
MAASIAFSSIIGPLTPLYDPEGIPAKWIDCPRKSAVIAETFLAFKTPLDDRYKNDIQKENHWTCKMLIQNTKNANKKLGLVIDLTNTDRYYNSEVEFKPHGIQYKKIRCQGIDDAIDLFAKARQPGIYKQDYLNKLVGLFGSGNTLEIFAPPSPPWHQTASTTPSERKKRAHDGNDSAQSNKRFETNYYSKSLPKFAVDIPNVIPVGDKYLLDSIRSRCQSICGWKRQSFPGSQPVSLHRENYQLIFLSPYMVSWKADGTRYMMWIEDKDKVYMLDRNNNAFQILHMSFPRTSDGEQSLTNTLLDGEFVIDQFNNEKVYRYLVYDIIMINFDRTISVQRRKDLTMKDERIIERIGIIEDPNQTVISRLLPEQIMMRRIRTTLLILLGFLLMSDLVGLVLFVHFHVHGSKPSSKLNIKRELLWRVFSVFYYAFGLIATIQYFRKGLCVVI